MIAWILFGAAAAALLACLGLLAWAAFRPIPPCPREHVDEQPTRVQADTAAVGPTATGPLWVHTPGMSAQTQPIKRVGVMSS